MAQVKGRSGEVEEEGEGGQIESLRKAGTPLLRKSKGSSLVRRSEGGLGPGVALLKGRSEEKLQGESQKRWLRANPYRKVNWELLDGSPSSWEKHAGRLTSEGSFEMEKVYKARMEHQRNKGKKKQNKLG